MTAINSFQKVTAMKNRIFYSAALLLALFLTSCTEVFEDPFGDPVDKFLGNWKVNEVSSLYGGHYVYDVSITRNPDNSTEILISNFYMQGPNEKARALVSGYNITIPEQTICNGTISIKGNGLKIGGVITLNYSANDSADLDKVSATFRRP